MKWGNCVFQNGNLQCTECTVKLGNYNVEHKNVFKTTSDNKLFCCCEQVQALAVALEIAF